MPQPTNTPGGAEGAWNEALIEQAWEAFQREAPLLIPEHAGEWVAYHGEKRLAFAPTRAEREAAGDPRPSLEERYGGREAYVAKVKAAAEALVAERLLLPADAAAYVETANACDQF